MSLCAAAKEKMNGRMLIGRPLLVRLVDEQTNKEELLGDTDDFDQVRCVSLFSLCVPHFVLTFLTFPLTFVTFLSLLSLFGTRRKRRR